MSDEPFVSAKVIAERFGLPQYAVYRLVDAGKIPAHPLPKPIWHTSSRRQLQFKVSEVARALGRDPEPE
jgi:hypothetical protein